MAEIQTYGLKLWKRRFDRVLSLDGWISSTQRRQTINNPLNAERNYSPTQREVLIS